jgi:hypothetical protein
MPSYDILPANGLDRSDGSGMQWGTYIDPEDIPAVIAQRIATDGPDGAGSFLEEDPASPRIDFSEQTTVQHVLWCDCGIPGSPGMYNGTLAMMIPLIQRGQIYTDSYGDVSRVLNSVVERAMPNICRITITCEGMNFGLPPDEFSVEPMEINPDLMKHPRYNYGQNGNTDTGYGLTAQQKGILRYALSLNNIQAQDAFNAIFGSPDSSGNYVFPFVSSGFYPGGKVTWSMAQAQMAWEIIQKTWRGEDTWYLPALVITWSTYIFPLVGDLLPGLNPGGYVEDPTNGFDAAVPYWLWSIDGTNDNSFSNQIFQKLSTYNSDLYFNGVTWLRKADRLDFVRTWYKYTRTWIGAPTGPKDAGGQNYIYWDPDLYPQWNGSTGFISTGLGPLPGPST